LNISFESHIEFIANDRNTLGFNPRAIIWEEGFLFTNRHDNSFWQVGYFHRCKHDIDNYNERQERSMIYGGLLFKYITPLKKHEFNNWIYLSLRSELYTILQDERSPQKHMEIKPNIEQLIGSLSLNLNSNYGISKDFGFYYNIYGSANFFSQYKSFFNRFKSLHEIQLSGGVSAGLTLQGDAHIRLGLNYEYIPDNLIDIIPTSSSLLSFGIMIVDPQAML
ncbi:MAG: hypothetical protein R3250_04705, partial [Melioribacteraceae bacterium]|nr:hypothetical protein [Melioribacteraceae bacterium]